MGLINLTQKSGRIFFVLSVAGFIGCRPVATPTTTSSPPAVSPPNAAQTHEVSDASAAEDRAAIERMFAEYRNAISTADGKKAAQLLAAPTIAEYQQYRDWALTADRSELSQKRLDQQRQALFYRLRLTAEQLEQMDGKSLFAHAVNEEWIAKETVAGLSLHDIRVNGDTAIGQLASNGKPTTSEFHFVRENGNWRLDLSIFAARAGERLKGQVEKTGKSMDEYLLENLSELEGETVDENVWTPLKK